jgi:hypothetical protein
MRIAEEPQTTKLFISGRSCAQQAATVSRRNFVCA